MRFGAQIPGNQTSWEAMRDVAQIMDQGRWDSVWTFDHFVPPLAFMDEAGDCLEGWMTLAGLGEATERIKLGTIVSGNTYRNPALLAKMTATLDVMTNGRASSASAPPGTSASTSPTAGTSRPSRSAPIGWRRPARSSGPSSRPRAPSTTTAVTTGSLTPPSPRAERSAPTSRS